ncbi:MAG: AAA family ATPase, partial [Calditrichota bacterium]
RNTIIIMTSNLGSQFIMQKMEHITPDNREIVYEEMREEVLRQLKQNVRPEFLNRIDDVVVFEPLTLQDVEDIVRLQFERLQKRINNMHVSADLSEDAVHHLAEMGYDPSFGARPVKRVLQKEVIDRLATLVLEDTIQPGDGVKIDYRDHAFQFDILERKLSADSQSAEMGIGKIEELN